jgi:hypothetical protein
MKNLKYLGIFLEGDEKLYVSTGRREDQRAGGQQVA